eukprot:2650954-Prymnesium_polylepis.1
MGGGNGYDAAEICDGIKDANMPTRCQQHSNRVRLVAQQLWQRDNVCINAADAGGFQVVREAGC